MATFKILESRNCPGQHSERGSKIKVELLDGELVPGERFRLYETHHYIDYTVVSVQRVGETCVVCATPDLWYDGWHEGTILDTKNFEAGAKYGFGGAGRYLYHPDALKSLGLGGDQTQQDE